MCWALPLLPVPHGHWLLGLLSPSLTDRGRDPSCPQMSRCGQTRDQTSGFSELKRINFENRTGHLHSSAGVLWHQRPCLRSNAGTHHLAGLEHSPWPILTSPHCKEWMKWAGDVLDIAEPWWWGMGSPFTS